MAIKKGEEKSSNDLSDMSTDTEKVFDEAFKEGDKGTSGSEKAEKTEKTVETTVDDKSTAGTTGTQEEKPKEEPSDKSTSGEDYEQKYNTLQGLWKQEKTEKEALKGEIDGMRQKIADIEKLQQGTPAEKKEAKEIKAELIKQLTDLYADLSDEDKAALATYDEEFDTVSKSEAKKRELFAKKMAAFVNSAVEDGNKQLLTQLAPFLLASEKNTEEAHFTGIKAAHPDFEKYRDDGSLKAWIDKQPSYIKSAMQKVYDEGETQDVIDLYSRFKQENNIGNTRVPDDKKKNEQLDLDKKKKLDDMEVVDSGNRPVGATGGVGKAEDYDGAFDEALKKAGM